MKKLILTLFVLITLSSNVLSQDTFDANKAFAWLVAHSSNGNYNNDIMTTAFATIALKDSGALDYASLGLDYIKSQEDQNHCWPKGSCKPKDTAFALWVLKEFGEDTSQGEEYLRRSLIAALTDNWFLEVITQNNGTCKISYEKGNTTTEKPVRVEAGKFPTCQGSFPDTFFDLNNCLETNLLNRNPSIELDINCNELGPSTLISIIYNTDSTFFLVSEAMRSRFLATIENGCFGSGSSCNTDATLFANWLLTKVGSDIRTLLWLQNNYDSLNPVHNALLYLSTQESIKEKYLADLKSKQRNDGSFNREIIDTSIAILALKESASSQELQSAIDFLKSRQSADGSFDSNLLKTAISLYAAFSGATVSLPPITVIVPGAGECGDGICDPGESSTCQSDCQEPSPCIVNGECESEFGENAQNCPQDCQETQPPEPEEQEICGNNIKEGFEECDDGNLEDGDGCSSTCLVEVEEEKGGLFWYILIAILIIIGIGSYFIYTKYYKQEAKKPGQKFEFKPFTSKIEQKPQQPFTGFMQPPKEAPKSKVEDELEKSLREARKLLKKL